MTLDFGALPPEINSTRMYTGPGSAPMQAASAAWNNVAAELTTTAWAAQSVISTLTGDEWRGASSAAMAAASMPYVEWMHTTAAASQRAASQAMASAAAYEAAFAMTVPPPVIAANRAQLAALVATNVLGLNTPAIMATEALYGEMWAQDAAAMYGYAGSSSAAGALTPLTPPPAAGTAASSAALPGLVSSLQGATQSLSSPVSAAASPAQGLLTDLFNDNLFQNTGNAIFDVGSWNGFNAIVTGILYGNTYAHPALAATEAAGAVPGAAPGVLAATVAPAMAPAGSAVLANAGQASPVGKLSVPAGWSAGTPTETAAGPAAPRTGSGWTAPAEEPGGMSTVATGMPAYASAGRGGYGIGPRYGVKPTVMPRQVFV